MCCSSYFFKIYKLWFLGRWIIDFFVFLKNQVVANDVDFQRSNLLIHQTKRMCTSNLIVTNHEGQQFPGCRLNKSRASEKGISEDMPINQLSFDRVLCDVPCSGDGTLRKAPDIWRKWCFHLCLFFSICLVMSY